jgi:hypothetical protein
MCYLLFILNILIIQHTVERDASNRYIIAIIHFLGSGVDECILPMVELFWSH